VGFYFGSLSSNKKQSPETIFTSFRSAGKEGGKAKPLKVCVRHLYIIMCTFHVFWCIRTRTFENNMPVGSADTASASSNGDCLSCRITGTIVCTGLSSYMVLSTYANPPRSPILRSLTLACAGGLAALGLARAVL